MYAGSARRASIVRKGRGFESRAEPLWTGALRAGAQEEKRCDAERRAGNADDRVAGRDGGCRHAEMGEAERERDEAGALLASCSREISCAHAGEVVLELMAVGLLSLAGSGEVLGVAVEVIGRGVHRMCAPLAGIGRGIHEGVSARWRS